MKINKLTKSKVCKTVNFSTPNQKPMKYKKLIKLVNKRNEFVKTHNFSNYSIKKIRKVIGKDLTSKLADFFKEDKLAIKWFYSPAPYFNGSSPNEHYKINSEEVKKEIKMLYYEDLMSKRIFQNH